MDGPDMLKVIHAAPLLAAKRRGNKARQRGAFEGLKTLVEDYTESQNLSVVHLRAEERAHRQFQRENRSNAPSANRPQIALYRSVARRGEIGTHSSMEGIRQRQLQGDAKSQA